MATNGCAQHLRLSCDCCNGRGKGERRFDHPINAAKSAACRATFHLKSRKLSFQGSLSEARQNVSPSSIAPPSRQQTFHCSRQESTTPEAYTLYTFYLYHSITNPRSHSQPQPQSASSRLRNISALKTFNNMRYPPSGYVDTTQPLRGRQPTWHTSGRRPVGIKHGAKPLGTQPDPPTDRNPTDRRTTRISPTGSLGNTTDNLQGRTHFVGAAR